MTATPRPTRRTLLRTAPLLGGAAPFGWAAAQVVRPVRIIVPFTPAGTTDLVARLAAERLAPLLGVPVLVENRPGAGGNLGAEFVARSDPDGTTLLLTTIGTGAINFAVYGDRMPYKPGDLAAVGLLTRVPNVLLAANGLAARDVMAAVSSSRAGQGGLTYGTAGVGTSPHVCMELFAELTGARLTHVPYRGSGPMLTELVAGRIDLGMDNIPSALPFVRDGQMRALATTGARRSNVLPDVPTLAEAGVADFEATAWFGLLAPAGTPAATIARLGAATDAVARDAGVRARLTELGAELPALTPDGGTSPAAFEAFLAAERTRWTAVVRRSGAKVE